MQSVVSHPSPSLRRPAIPPSARAPSRALSRPDVESIAQELVSYHAQFADLFARREQHSWSLFYLRGQLSDLPRKTVEPMVFALHGQDPNVVRSVQNFLGEGAWDDAPIRKRHQQLVADTLGEPDAIVICDGSGFPKQGKHSIGVARQYCGRLGKISNCQQGVFVAYASSRGATLLDAALYIPQRWFENDYAQRRARCGLPQEVVFTTEPMLALRMVKGLCAREELPFSWVLGDETYGADPKFLDGVAALGKSYFVEVPRITRVFVGPVQLASPESGKRGRRPKHPQLSPETAPPREVQQVATTLPTTQWSRQRLKEGSKGPIVAEVACLRVTRAQRKGRPGAPAWLVLRRGVGPDAELKMFLSNAPDDTPAEVLGQLTAQRWPVETVLEESKSELGMDHYEVRSFRGWHHQMTQTMLAHHFLVRLQRSQEKKVLH